jgi:hypothetical protein
LNRGIKKDKEGITMAKREEYNLSHRQQFVWVKDRAGNEYACPVNVLKKPEEMTEEEKKNCINDASVPQPHAGG